MLRTSHRTLTICAALLTPLAVESLATAQVTQLAKLTPADGPEFQNFGCAVAIDGDTALVGALGDDELAQGAGAAYIFERVDGVWVQRKKIFAPDGDANDLFGRTVALDGDTAVVGTPNKGAQQGAAYVFVREGDAWTHQATLAPEKSFSEAFGSALCLAGDSLVIGSWGAEAGDINRAGAVFIYERSGSTWTRTTTLHATDAGEDDFFGSELARHGDTLFVTARGVDDAGRDSGAVYVFERDGSEWVETAKLLPDAGSPRFSFGTALAATGSVLAVGSLEDADIATEGGAVYVFDRDGAGWMRQAKFASSDLIFRENFGASVVLVEGGETLIVGASSDELSVSRVGAAYVFRRVDAQWIETEKFRPSNPSQTKGFGIDLDLDGDTLLVGASIERPGGAAYIFTLDADDNQPPVCPEPVVVDLWPPNHKFESFDLASLVEVTDPDGDEVTITIDSVASDEPANGVGDGNTSPDAVITGATTIDIRRERSGEGDGRVYTVAYTATDPDGASCQGVVEFRVPLSLAEEAGGGDADADPARALPAGDLNADGVVDAGDLSMVLGSWGASAAAGAGHADADADMNGVVDAQDLGLVLSDWGKRTEATPETDDAEATPRRRKSGV